MAKSPGELTVTLLKPSDSKNGRRYTSENIGSAVKRMQERIKSPAGLPVTSNVSHKATLEGDVTKTAAYLRKVWQESDGRARGTLRLVDTQVGRDVAALAKPDEDGHVALKGVSIFGRWASPTEQTEDGLETAKDLEVVGIDFTHHPGVEGAGIDSTDLGESVPVGHFGESADIDETSFVEVVAEAAVAPNGLPVGYVEEASKKPYGDVTYADPGYQADKKARYPLDSEEHVRAAWSYVNQKGNGGKYSAPQLARIKSKIKAAAKKYGIDIQGESEAFVGAMEDALVSLPEPILEAYASMSLSHGGGSVSSSGYARDPKALKLLAQKIAAAVMAGIVDHLPAPDDDRGAAVVDSDCSQCLEPLTEGSKFCSQCGHEASGAVAAPADPMEEGDMPLNDTDKAAIAEMIAASNKALIEQLQATPPPGPAADPPAGQESELDKAKRLIAEAELAEAAKPMTRAEAQALAAEAAKAAVDAFQTSAVRDYRVNPGRKGLVESLEKLVPDADKAKENAAALKEMSSTDLYNRFIQNSTEVARAAGIGVRL